MKEFDYDSFPWSDHFRLDESSPSGLAWNRVSYSLGGNKLETWVCYLLLQQRWNSV